MKSEEWSEFGGVAGRLVTGSISGGSLVSGIVLGLGLLFVDWMLVFANASAMIMPFNLIVLALVLARFAVNGLYGEWSGTVFSGAGGPWTVVGAVALRYMALTFIWYMPLALIGMKVVQPPAGAPIAALPMMMGGALVLGAIHILAMTITPPLFLIVSVSATNFGDVFSADHWRRLFVGRKDDLFTVYVVYAGALLMVAMVSLPVVMLAMAATYKLAILVGGLSFGLLFGVSVNLLGRLCGFFACGELGLIDRQVGQGHGPDPVPGAAPGVDAASPVVPSVNAPVAPPHPPELPSQPTATAAAQPVAAAPPASAAVTATSPVPYQTPSVGDGTRRPLEDAKAKVDAAIQSFAENPDAALAALQALNAEFAPHPLVLQSLALHNYRAGRIEPSIALAREAIPLCFERGHSYLAAELFSEMRQYRSQLALTMEQLLTVGHTLMKMEDFATAAKAYTAVIGQDNSESRAVKGLLQVAEKILHEKHKPEAAIKVYQYLLQHCSSSPLLEFMQTGLEEAERTMAQATAG
jgi:hypothetical protein